MSELNPDLKYIYIIAQNKPLEETIGSPVDFKCIACLLPSKCSLVPKTVKGFLKEIGKCEKSNGK